MKIVFSVIIGLLFQYSHAQHNWRDLGLKGKVKSLKTQETYRYKKNGVDFTPWEKTYARNYLFDNTGRYTEFEEINADGTGGYRIRYNNKVKEKKVEESYFNKDDKPTITKINTLDEKGRMIGQREFTAAGQPDRYYVYTYDLKGNMITMTGKKPDGTIISTYNWTYDDKNQKTGLKLETPGYANSYQDYRYDARGNQVEERWYDGKKELSFRFERVYDDKGNKIEESKYKGMVFRDKITWKYEYDKQGNWTKRTQFTAEGEDFQVVERVITYF